MAKLYETIQRKSVNTPEGESPRLTLARKNNKQEKNHTWSKSRKHTTSSKNRAISDLINIQI